jgi:hypothetical protein
MVDKYIRIDSVEELNYFNRSSEEVSALDFNNLTVNDGEQVEPVEFESRIHYTRNDFEVSLICGKGAYAKVVKAKCLRDNDIKALKIMDKCFLIKVISRITIRRISYIKSMWKIIYCRN